MPDETKVMPDETKEVGAGTELQFNDTPLPKRPGFFRFLWGKDPVIYFAFVLGFLFLGLLFLLVLFNPVVPFFPILFYIVCSLVAAPLCFIYGIYSMVKEKSFSSLMTDVNNANDKEATPGAEYALLAVLCEQEDSIQRITIKGTGGAPISSISNLTGLYLAFQLELEDFNGKIDNSYANLTKNDNEKGENILHFAVREATPEVLKEVLKATIFTTVPGAFTTKINEKDKEGDTPLMCVIVNADMPFQIRQKLIAELLEIKGIDLNLTDAMGETPLQSVLLSTVLFNSNEERSALFTQLLDAMQVEGLSGEKKEESIANLQKAKRLLGEIKEGKHADNHPLLIKDGAEAMRENFLIKLRGKLKKLGVQEDTSLRVGEEKEIPSIHSGDVASGTGGSKNLLNIQPSTSPSGDSPITVIDERTGKPSQPSKSSGSRFGGFRLFKSKAPTRVVSSSREPEPESLLDTLGELYTAFNGGKDDLDEEKLWKQKVKVDGTSLTILQFALLRGSSDVLEELLKKPGATDEVKSEKTYGKGKSKESLLSWYFEPEVFVSILEKKDDKRKREEIRKLEKLIEAGANVSKPDGSGKTLLDRLIENEDEDDIALDNPEVVRTLGTLVSLLIEAQATGAYPTPVLRKCLVKVNRLEGIVTVKDGETGKDDYVSGNVSKLELQIALYRELVTNRQQTDITIPSAISEAIEKRDAAAALSVSKTGGNLK